MAYGNESTGYSTRVLFGFIAGFLATLVFHQLTLWALWGAGVAPFGPFSMAATKPFGLPAMLSLAFWGGIGASCFPLIERKFPARGGLSVRLLSLAPCSLRR